MSRPDAPVQFKQMICAVDCSDSSLSALAYALMLAEEADAHVTLLHVIEMPRRTTLSGRRHVRF